MTVLSITTDFGNINGFVGVMKGVIYGISPDVKIVDISQLISPQNVLEGAYAMWRAVPYFPPGSVHVGVVDPGVGTQRRLIGGHLGDVHRYRCAAFECPEIIQRKCYRARRR